MDWDKGYSSTYYMTIVDPVTWRDIETVQITGGSIKREATGLLESADIDCTGYDLGIEKWIRIHLNAKQASGSAHVPLFTGLATSPDTDIAGFRRENQLEAYSVLKPAEDVFLQRGWYTPGGIAGSSLIRELLSVSSAPIVVDRESPALRTSIVAEDDETNLSMAHKILAALNWRLRITGDGTIHVEPTPTQPVAILSPTEYDVMETDIKIERDLFSCPNVFMAIYDDLTAIVRDDDPDSPLSTVSRGREVWMREDDCALAENESIGDYAFRRLREEQRVSLKAGYDRRYIPDVLPGDLISLHYPAQDLEGTFRIESQSVELSHAARTSENVTYWTEVKA